MKTSSNYMAYTCTDEIRRMLYKALAMTTLFLLAAVTCKAQSLIYSNTIASLNPAGYWPMHEVAAAAPGDIETNYGSLGTLGNAYYPDWQVDNGAFIRQWPGPLANGADKSVYFTNPNSNNGGATNSLIVPHTSPLTTLQVPFTIEMWFMFTNLPTVGFQNDIISQSSDARLSGFRVYYQHSSSTNESDVGFNILFYNNSQANQGFQVTVGAFPTNVWHYLVYTVDTNRLVTGYLDGRTRWSTPSRTIPGNRFDPDPYDPLTIGNGLGNKRGINGPISEVAIYTNALSLDQITNHWAIGTNALAGVNAYFDAVTNDHPILYYRMDSAPYTAPSSGTWPVAANYGSTAGNGIYSPGTEPGDVAGTDYNDYPLGSGSTNVTSMSGVSSYMDVGNAAAYNPTGTTPFTVSAIFRGNPTDTNRAQMIVGHGTNSWELGLTQNGYIVFNSGTNSTDTVATGTGAGDLISTTAGYDDGNWHQVMAVHNGTTNVLYVDGVANNTNVVAADNVGNSLDVLIGSDPCYTYNPMDWGSSVAQPLGVGAQFAGQICEVAFFTNALSASQVQTCFDSEGIPPRLSQTLPGSVSVNENGTLVIPAAVVGTPPFSYRWTNLSTIPPTVIPGQTNATLTVGNVSYATYNNAQLQLTVTNLYGAISATTLVSVITGPPTIVTDLPPQVDVVVGQGYTYSISATGTEPFHYQWFVNGTAVNGATSATFVPATGTPGTYSVYAVVTNIYNGNTPGMAVSSTSTLAVNTNIDYWVAPSAVGSGNGSSAANAANWRDSSFWSGVQGQLNSFNVTVNFVDGTYNAGNLVLQDMGDPLHQLTLQAANPYGAVLSPSSNDILELNGTQNIGLDGFVFTGLTSYWGILCQPDYLRPCRNLEISNCQFVNLTNAYYGAIGLVNGVRDVTVNNCVFDNLGYGTSGTAHFVYASHNIVGVQVLNSSFTDCRADYVRFRDDSEYCTVSNCTFLSTMSATAFPFITSPLYNTTSPGPGDEFFGTYFQITSNSFAYNVSAGVRMAFQFSNTGYDPQSYSCSLTSAQASQLSSASTSYKQSYLLTNMGINSSGIKMFGNTYNSRVSYHMAYTYGYASPTADISDVPDSSGALMGPTPVIRNGNFDRRGLLEMPVGSSTPNECLFQTWFCNPKYATILQHPGFDGTTNALLFNKTQNQYVYQWITPPGPMWTMDCEFAIGSGFSGSGTKFKIDLFHNDITGGKVSVGVNNFGQFGIYNGGTFTVLSGLGTVAFSVDNDGNGNYTDPGDTLNVYRLRIVGNYAAGVPYVDIYTSDANSHVLNHQSLDLASWVNGAPVSGQSSPGTIACYSYTAPVMLDQIAIGSGLAEQPPVINSVSSGSGKLIFSGTNGFPGDTYYLLSSTNLALGNWTVEGTNTFDANGAFSVTNPVTAGTPQKFYRLQLQ